jgi:methionyl aminopeptidase
MFYNPAGETFVMCIDSDQDLKAMQASGRIVALALDTMRRHVHPGVSTAELDAIGAEILTRHGARSAPLFHYRFPGTSCISVNDEIVHGIPGARVIQAGDLVKLDVTAELDGYITDAAVTVAVAPVNELAHRLVRCAEEAFWLGAAAAKAGGRVHDIGRAVEREVRSRGFSVIPALCGHGVGHRIHEDPEVPNYFEPKARQPLTMGLVLAIEPLITSGTGQSFQAPDGWTVRTSDGAPAAHFEHTLVVTRGVPLILTAA